MRNDADEEARAVAHLVEVAEGFRTELAYAPLNANRRRELDGMALKIVRHLLRGYKLKGE